MKKIKKMFDGMRNVIKGEKGATMVEYALMVVLIALVAMGAVEAVGNQLTGTFGTVREAIAP